MSDDTIIAVSAKRFEGLLKAEKKLLALEAGGVEDWEWYYESLKEAGLIPGDF